MTEIRVSHIFPDGYIEQWTSPHGADERDLKARRHFDRKGPGWAERDEVIAPAASLGFPEPLHYVARIEWLS